VEKMFNVKDAQNPTNSEKLIPQKPVREGWEKLFALMAENKDDQLIDDSLLNEFDTEEWFWDEA
jgi:hypothetical protein